MKAPAILLPKEPLPDLHEAPIHMGSYQKDFGKVFKMALPPPTCPRPASFFVEAVS